MIPTLEITRQKPRITGMIHYLASRCQGRDVLRFDSSAQATDAARTLRERHPEINVAASYDRVTISLGTVK
ncbi:MAG: hypothetical protein BWY85_00132 [Firmicutes bacterium ADurb.Bin506]|nr:MAG: hypothetical protein BWY85_00132 [Firmicutes bacterium ADurb.Bin506]